MTSLHLWSHSHYASLNEFNDFFEKFASHSFRIINRRPQVQLRNEPFNSYQASRVLTTIKDNRSSGGIHVILLSPNDMLYESNRDVLFQVCAALVEEAIKRPFVHLLFFGFFGSSKSKEAKYFDELRFQEKVKRLAQVNELITWHSCKRLALSSSIISDLQIEELQHYLLLSLLPLKINDHQILNTSK